MSGGSRLWLRHAHCCCFVLSSVCCSTGVGDAVQDLWYDSTVCQGIPSVASSCSMLLFYFVCCSTGVGDVVQDRHDPICFVLSPVCCSTGFGDAVQDRHDFIVCLVGPVCGFVMLDVVVLFDLLCVVQLALVNLVDLIPRL